MMIDLWNKVINMFLSSISTLFTGVFGKPRANSDYYKRDQTRNLRICCAEVLIENGLKKPTRNTQVT